nr:hypothetical protein [uncultured Mediterranean phage uvMED]
MAQHYEKQNAKVFVIDPGSSTGDYNGDLFFGFNNTATTAGSVYTPMIVSGTTTIWVQADQDVEGRYDGLLAIAVGSNSSSGMLLRGVVTSGEGLTIGGKIYLGDGGAFTQTAPSGSGDHVRVLGYALSDSTIYFNPDNTYIEVA